MGDAIDVHVFQAVEGSQTSSDGKGFALHVRRRDGSHAMLAFPHSEISNIVENAAMQLPHGRDKDGNVVTAFKTTGFQLGRGANREAVLTMIVGQTGKISFLLPGDMPENLMGALARMIATTDPAA